VSEHTFTPRISGFAWEDLFLPEKLASLTEVFYGRVRKDDPALWAKFDSLRQNLGTVEGPARSEIFIAMARHQSRFLVELFGIEKDYEAYRRNILSDDVVQRFKFDFVAKQVHKRLKAETLDVVDLPLVEKQASFLASGLAEAGDDPEKALSRAGVTLMGWAETLEKDKKLDPRAASFLESLRGEKLFASLPLAEGGEKESLAALLHVLALYTGALLHGRLKAEGAGQWTILRQPQPMRFKEGLVETERLDPARPWLLEGPRAKRRRRDGFGLTDARMEARDAQGEAHYCLLCHDRRKDSCSTGFPQGAGYRKNPLAIELEGCPLDQKISESHVLQREADSIAALALIMLDNPMLPGTGHRICNNCMKACIFQTQDPVNIPQMETRILTNVLHLPWGFEIYSLLLRWNPLNPERPQQRPYNGKNVLVVGLGPAGYTLVQHLIAEGFGVVGVDGLKIEPLPVKWTGDGKVFPEPIRDVSVMMKPLDRRILAGFGGVAEYGITVRWDKNFLTVIQAALTRHRTARFHGGVRFGGTVTIEDAWEMGFDHIAVAAGAGRPTIVPMKNNLIRGIRKASDFLMALQLTGAAKHSSLANLQVRLPAVVVGGGLTAIDTATELMAYYPAQVEKTLERFEALARDMGEAAVWGMYDEEEKEIFAEFLEHGRAVRSERARAAKAKEEPDFAPLVRKWGGVTIAYRKGMDDAPSYRLNHEEIIKAFEESILFAEGLSPVEAHRGRFGAVEAVTFERLACGADGKWASAGETVKLPARAVFVAAGTSPNTIYEKERPGTFEKDEKGYFFKPFRLGASGALEPDSSAQGVFTSYDVGGKKISFFGDNHPRYAGNVVKAMASAKQGYPQILALFPERGPRPLASWERLAARLDEDWRPRVLRVERLTPTIVEVILKAPAQARHFRPGQFFRLQNYETHAGSVEGTSLAFEGIALTGAWTDPKEGVVSLIALELGASSRLCAELRPGEPVVCMGPTGTPSEIVPGENVVLCGGGLGNAVLFSIGRAMREAGCRVVYFAGYKKPEDVFHLDDIEVASDAVVWSVDAGEPIRPRRSRDMSFVGNIVQAMQAYQGGSLGEKPFDLREAHRLIAIGSDRMMAAVKASIHGALEGCFGHHLKGVASINSIMQCMMKEVCAQCLQRHVDPSTGREMFVFSCFNQDQPMEHVDFQNLNERLKTNSVQEKLTNLYLTWLKGRERKSAAA
jgi:NADPH-dependent glutamate synthase beta subunit-like oxidoreductase/NAD(P)H-flavin reductase